MATPLIQTWSRRLLRRFSPRRIRLGADGPYPLGGGGGALHYLVGRELCLFLRVDASKVPGKQRDSFVELAVRQAAPYQDPAFDFNWVGDQAATWYWSRSRVQDLLGRAPDKGSRMSAEAAHVGSVLDEGVELLELHAGFEGRVWRKRSLVASRWWANPPSATDWQAFLRGAGIVAAAGVPTPAAGFPSERRWSESSRGRAGGLQLAALESHLPRLSLGVVLAALALFSWQTGSIARAMFDANRADSAARGLDDSLTRILDARNRADSARAEIDALLRLREGVPQHRLLGEVARLTTGTGARVRVWQQPHPERIEATLAMASPDPEALVTAWEDSPLFADVTAELSRQPGEVVVRAAVQKPALQ